MKPVVLLYNYQTLIAGLLALGGAMWTVRTLNKQIKQADKQENERRQRRHLAARSMVPVALSELCDYSRRCVKLLLPLFPAEQEQRVTAPSLDAVPSIPAGAVLALGQCVELGDDPIREQIADLIRKLQIQHSRLTGIKDWLESPDKIVVRTNIVNLILDALEIYARSAKLFPYGRREDNTVEAQLVAADFELAAHNCEIWDNTEIFDAITRKFE